MSLCPACGRVYCDHEPDERGQTAEEMMRILTPEEVEAWQSNDTVRKLEVAQRLAHLPPRTTTDAYDIGQGTPGP